MDTGHGKPLLRTCKGHYRREHMGYSFLVLCLRSSERIGVANATLRIRSLKRRAFSSYALLFPPALIRSMYVLLQAFAFARRRHVHSASVFMSHAACYVISRAFSKFTTPCLPFPLSFTLLVSTLLVSNVLRPTALERVLLKLLLVNLCGENAFCFSQWHRPLVRCARLL